MWKSKWKIDKTWILGKEKWLVLLIGGLILLILAVPTGWGSAAAAEAVSVEERTGAEPAALNSQSAAGEQISPLLSSGSGDPVRLYEKELEKRVKEILKNVEGVGTVDVMIMLHSSGEKIIHVDQERSRTSTEEQDSSGGTRKVMTEETSQTALMSGSSGSQEPVIEKEIQPEIAGVVISAQGGGSAQVKAEISEAMEALFGLPAHKIKVLKRVE